MLYFIEKDDPVFLFKRFLLRGSWIFDSLAHLQSRRDEDDRVGGGKPGAQIFSSYGLLLLTMILRLMFTNFRKAKTGRLELNHITLKYFQA